jgi:hypothetical protein
MPNTHRRKSLESFKTKNSIDRILKIRYGANHRLMPWCWDHGQDTAFESRAGPPSPHRKRDFSNWKAANPKARVARTREL